jgi:hypothetical protein
MQINRRSKGKVIPIQACTGSCKGVEAARRSRQSIHEGGKFVRPTHWPPLIDRSDPSY